MLFCIRRLLERALETIAIVLLTILSVLVLVGVLFRTIEHPIVWYDEVASILLAWLTYFGAALAALKRAHIGCPGIVAMLPLPQRRVALTLAEFCVFGFFVLLAYTGWKVFEVIAGDTLVTLPWVPQQLAQAIIPLGAVLFIVAEALSLPEAWRGRVGHNVAEGDIVEQTTATE
ncbi:MAG: TRAP transporter small permease subunit [Alphaproteobacteria bacterium]|nr:TRAP transporter small permease subunit [Alphaproteobacteria bacterium]